MKEFLKNVKKILKKSYEFQKINESIKNKNKKFFSMFFRLFIAVNKIWCYYYTKSMVFETLHGSHFWPGRYVISIGGAIVLLFSCRKHIVWLHLIAPNYVYSRSNCLRFSDFCLSPSPINYRRLRSDNVGEYKCPQSLTDKTTLSAIRYTNILDLLKSPRREATKIDRLY